MIPDHASEIFIGNNECEQDAPGKFDVGIGLLRANDVTGGAHKITVLGNTVKPTDPAALDNGAFMVKPVEACLLDNEVRNSTLAAWFKPGSIVYLNGNDWGGGRVRAESPNVEEIDDKGRQKCFVPEFLYFDQPRAKAWVWADRPSADEYTPSQQYQYNSANQSNRVSRLGQGRYRIDLPGSSAAGGMVQVSAYGDNHYCNVVSWNAVAADQKIRVNCFDPTGNAVDGRFTVLFYKEKRGEPWRDAYLWANRPTSPAYTPHRDHQWNSQGSDNSIRRLGRGRYQVRLPGMDRLGGTVLVTAYGPGSEKCKTARWQRSGGDTLVHVNCHDPRGRQVDAMFVLSYMTDVELGIRVSEDQHYGGYVWADKPRSASYTPSTTYQLNNAGGPNTIIRRSKGSHTVRFPRLKPSNRTTAQVTAYGNGSEYCTISNWSGESRGPVNVNVNCFDNAGQPVDTRFTLTYLTDEQILF